MPRTIALSIATLALFAGLAVAEPEVTLTYRSGVPVIQLAGNYARSYYTVYRAGAGNPEFLAITSNDLLCLGECLVADYDALPGQTYLYRFDLTTQAGPVSYGPYAVTIPRERAINARVFPNPGRGPATISLTLAGRPGDPAVEVEAALFDIEGRALRTLHRGTLRRGTTTALEWDGRDGKGRPLGSGLYFLRIRSAVGNVTTPVARTR